MSTIIKPRTAVVTIYQGDYLDRIDYLRRQAEAAAEAEQSGPRRSGQKSEAMRLAAEHDALVAEANETAVHVKVQALGRKAWRELVDAHPPRDGNDEDKAAGVNEDTFKDALVAASIVEPEMTEGERVDFLDYMSSVDYDRIYVTAFSLNRVVAADPKSSLASRLTRSSDEI